MKKLHLEVWAEGLPIPLAMFAHQVALSVEPVFEGCQRVRSRKWGSREDDPVIPRGWLKLYEEERSLLSPPGVVVGEVLGFGASARDRAGLSSFVDGVSAARTQSKAEWKKDLEEVEDWPEVIRQSVAMWKELYEIHLEGLRADLKEDGEPPPSGYEEVLCKPRVAFYLQVAFPCWMEYHVSPSVLFKQARDGDYGALVKLLQLDTRVLEDRQIRRNYIAILQSGNHQRARRISDAMLGDSLRESNESKVLETLAALVWKAFKRFDDVGQECRKRAWKLELNHLRFPRTKLSFPKVEALFNAAARDMGRGLTHPAIRQGKPWAFAQQVRPYAQAWPDIF